MSSRLLQRSAPPEKAPGRTLQKVDNVLFSSRRFVATTMPPRLGRGLLLLPPHIEDDHPLILEHAARSVTQVSSELRVVLEPPESRKCDDDKSCPVTLVLLQVLERRFAGSRRSPVNAFTLHQSPH